MLNVTIVGNLGGDAETKTVGSGGQVTEWSVAVNRRARGEDETAWLRCSLWGDRGARIAPHLTRGKRVVVTGELWPREYAGNDGTRRTSLDVRVQDVEFASNRREEDGGGHQPAPAYGEPASYVQTAPVAPVAMYDDEIPF